MHVSSFHLSLCYSTSNYFDTLSLHDALPIYLGFDSAQLLMSMDNDMPTDSTHRTLGAGTGISSLKSAVEAQGGDLDQIIETDQHELRLSLPLTAPARRSEERRVGKASSAEWRRRG